MSAAAAAPIDLSDVPPASSLPVLTTPLSELRKLPFPEMKNDVLLRAALNQQLTPADHCPVWCHRQAGRFLPEFRNVRLTCDFFTLCRTPTLACEVTLQPIRRFALDAAIIFSDILVVPQVMGLEVEMKAKEGPHFPQPLKTIADFARVKSVEETNVKESLSYVYDAITLTRHSLCGRVPLIGFSGAPWTLFAYMVEGGGKKSYDHARAFMYSHPKECAELLDRLTKVITQYLLCQVRAGAQMLELFDSWASDLTPQLYSQFALPCVTEIARVVKAEFPHVPFTYFPKGAHFAFADLSATAFDVIAIDWSTSPALARKALPTKALQGNLDVSILFADEDVISRQTSSMLQAFGTRGYIANLGHGMLPDHEPNKLKCFIESVHKHSKQMLQVKTQYSKSSATDSAANTEPINHGLFASSTQSDDR